MINQRRDGGGNVHFESSLVIRRNCGIGDVLCATTVADKLADQGYLIKFQAAAGIHCVLRRQPNIDSISECTGFTHINLDDTYERDPYRRNKHFHQMFFEAANHQLRARGMEVGKPINCKPKLRLRANETAAAINKFREYPRPWVFCCPRSNSYNVRQVPDGIWAAAAPQIEGTKFWMGTHPAPAGFVDLQIRHLDNLIVWLSVADLLISVDTGPLHIGAALGVPILALGQSSSPELHLSNQCDFVTIWPKGLDCLDCQKNFCPKNQHIPPCQNFDPDEIAIWANARLGIVTRDEISASIPIYRPPAERLNKCISAVIDQVSEVVVAVDLAGRIPEGAMRHPKIRYYTLQQNDTGYGKKQTFANRHTNSRYILQLNDDCYVQPDTVSKLREVVTEDTGMVACLLKYPDGRIQHAGTIRAPGQRGWHHLDQHKHDWSIKQPCEMENVTGACVLVRRKAFFEVDGFDEEFYLCCEDNDLCLKMRKAGWKIMYTPLTSAIHEESTTSRHTPNFIQIIQQSNFILGRKWNEYFEWNKNRVPLGNFDYLKA